jgi:KDO2-lipid IV(A) lauroyltransferase
MLASIRVITVIFKWLCFFLRQVHVKIVGLSTAVMTMIEDARNIISSPFGLTLANLIGKYTPSSLGHRLAFFIADFISARKSWNMILATRCNQWVANGEGLNDITLDRLVRENIRNIAIAIYDYYHNINNPVASLQTIVPHPFAVQLVLRPEFSERGLIVAGIHMSNFEMIYQMGGLADVKALVITLPELNEAYQKQWEIRRKSGLGFVTASLSSMKYAINYLSKGGLVITAIDRPDQASSYKPKFFGHPATLPVHHIFLALKAHVPVVVAAIIKLPNGMHDFLFSDPIEMIPHPDRHTEVMINAENVLHVAEDFIRHDTTQWSMTFPIWPELLPQVKSAGRQGRI